MPALAAADPAEAGSSAHRFERRAMGSPLRLTVSGAPTEAAAAAWKAASDEIEAVEQACSRFRPSTDLVRLNSRSGDPVGLSVDRRLMRALVAADRAYRLTDGRFDARVLGMLEALGDVALPRAARVLGMLEGLGDVALPRAAQDMNGRAAISIEDSHGWRASGLRADPRGGRVAVERPVDLGGIGKGLALRWAGRAAVATLRNGVAGSATPGLLLEAGGDLVVDGQAPEGGPWMIGVEDPMDGPDPVAVVAVDRGAVCTSSVRIRSWHDADGRPVHHLIDPATGQPGGEGLLSVTVAGEDPAWAEVRSKTLFLAGARAIGAQARALDIAAWWVDASGDLGMTPHARLLTAWTR